MRLETFSHLTDDQKALLKWITAGLAIPEVRQLHGDAGYLLSNMIAKFTLSANQYRLSIGAAELLRQNSVDLRRIHKRSKFYGKSSPFIYEHSIPCSLVRARLLESDPHVRKVHEMLLEAGPVVMILRSEDNELRASGLSNSMPTGWDWGDDPLARYKKARIRISRAVLKVDGKIKR